MRISRSIQALIWEQWRLALKLIFVLVFSLWLLETNLVITGTPDADDISLITCVLITLAGAFFLLMHQRSDGSLGFGFEYRLFHLPVRTPALFWSILPTRMLAMVLLLVVSWTTHAGIPYHWIWWEDTTAKFLVSGLYFVSFGLAVYLVMQTLAWTLATRAGKIYLAALLGPLLLQFLFWFSPFNTHVDEGLEIIKWVNIRLVFALSVAGVPLMYWSVSRYRRGYRYQMPADSPKTVKRTKPLRRFRTPLKAQAWLNYRLTTRLFVWFVMVPLGVALLWLFGSRDNGSAAILVRQNIHLLPPTVLIIAALFMSGFVFIRRYRLLRSSMWPFVITRPVTTRTLALAEELALFQMLFKWWLIAVGATLLIITFFAPGESYWLRQNFMHDRLYLGDLVSNGFVIALLWFFLAWIALNVATPHLIVVLLLVILSAVFVYEDFDVLWVFASVLATMYVSELVWAFCRRNVKLRISVNVLSWLGFLLPVGVYTWRHTNQHPSDFFKIMAVYSAGILFTLVIGQYRHNALYRARYRLSAWKMPRLAYVGLLFVFLALFTMQYQLFSENTDSLVRNLGIGPKSLVELNEQYGRDDGDMGGASDLLDAEARLREVDFAHLPPTEEYKQLRIPYIGYGEQLAIGEPLPSDVKSWIKAYHKDSVPYIQDMLAALQYHYFRYPINFEDGLNARIPHLTRLRGCARYLALDALWHAENHDTEKAYRALDGCFRVGGTLNNEPILISQLVSMACEGIACGAVQEVMARTDLHPDQLRALQSQIIQQTWNIACGQDGDLPPLAKAWQVDIIMFSESLESMGFFEQSTLNGNKYEDFLLGNCMGRIASDTVGFTWTSREGYSGLLQEIERLNWRRNFGNRVNVQNFNTYTLWREISAIDVKLTEREEAGNGQLTGNYAGALLRSYSALMRDIAQLRCALLGCAIETYRLEQGHLPESLDLLVPDYIESIPWDPYTEQQPLHYRRGSEGSPQFDDDCVCHAMNDDENRVAAPWFLAESGTDPSAVKSATDPSVARGLSPGFSEGQTRPALSAPKVSPSFRDDREGFLVYSVGENEQDDQGCQDYREGDIVFAVRWPWHYDLRTHRSWKNIQNARMQEARQRGSDAIAGH